MTCPESTCMCSHPRSVHTREHPYLDGVGAKRVAPDACANADCISNGGCSGFDRDRARDILSGSIEVPAEEKRWHELVDEIQMKRLERQRLVREQSEARARDGGTLRLPPLVGAMPVASRPACTFTAHVFEILLGSEPPSPPTSAARVRELAALAAKNGLVLEEAFFREERARFLKRGRTAKCALCGDESQAGIVRLFPDRYVRLPADADSEHEREERSKAAGWRRNDVGDLACDLCMRGKQEGTAPIGWQPIPEWNADET